MSNTTADPTRRDLLLAGAGLAALSAAGTAQAAEALPTTATTNRIPMRLPRTEFVYEAVVDILPTLQLGKGPLGERRMVPISGGTFEGPGIKGRVLAGGADRQLVRADGVVELDALYEMQTDDGVIITVRNRVTVRSNPRYAFSKIDITAPEGLYGWLNQSVYVGTLDSARPEREAVVVRVYRLV